MVSDYVCTISSQLLSLGDCPFCLEEIFLEQKGIPANTKARVATASAIIRANPPLELHIFHLPNDETPHLAHRACIQDAPAGKSDCPICRAVVPLWRPSLPDRGVAAELDPLSRDAIEAEDADDADVFEDFAEVAEDPDVFEDFYDVPSYPQVAQAYSEEACQFLELSSNQIYPDPT